MIQFITDIFTSKVGDLTTIEIWIGTLLFIAATWLGIKIVKYTWIAIKAIFKAIKNTLSAKEKCKRIQCIHCGRTLDRCICERNKKKSCVSRLMRYNKEHRNK